MANIPKLLEDAGFRAHAWNMDTSIHAETYIFKEFGYMQYYFITASSLCSTHRTNFEKPSLRNS